MTTTREITWLSLVLQADPDHTRDSRNVIEYEFPSPSKGSAAPGATYDLTHENGLRIFKGDVETRGPYS